MTVLHLPIAPGAYWLHAHGEGGGADFDLVMERDVDGLPVLRGRHVTGLLRLALRQAEAWGWFPNGAVGVAALLLGEIGDHAPGCLAVGDARVSDALRAALLADRRLIDGLFARVASTAIDHETGAAKPKHLRTLEAAVPMTLLSALSFEPDRRRLWARGEPQALTQIEQAKRHWRAWIACAWPALSEVGAKRTRGFGRLRWCELSKVELSKVELHA